MFRILKNGLLSFIFTFISIEKCTSELQSPPALVLYSPGSLEYSEVLVRRMGDNLTLICELRGDREPRRYLWNYLADDDAQHQPMSASPSGPTLQSTLVKTNLQVSDSGQFICSAPPYSQKKYILVQTIGPSQCARGAFRCGARCVLPSYVCDGRADCERAEDEAAGLCGELPCLRADRLNCSSGRCVPEAACCGRPDALCRQPRCCDEHPRYTRIDGFVDVEYPALFEDRHATDEYGFIQSTIYTVTACALIFMIAVVLLVSAICKMHMKRAALRSLAQRPQHHTRQMYGTPRFPPCYEASRLLEESRAPPAPSPCPAPAPAPAPGEPPASPAGGSPVRTPGTPPEPASCYQRDSEEQPRGLARLGAIFSSRYRQVPTNSEVEMTTVRSSSLHASPAAHTPGHYRSPAYCDLGTDFYFSSPDAASCGRDLNYMAALIPPRSPVDRLVEHLERPRPLTLQLGRFQLSIPRFGRRSSADSRRPDTPNVAEINIDDLDFVRLNSNETYTLNGRTIRLLGANFENYPTVGSDDVVRPPPYADAMRYKLYGPPPEYLSRDNVTQGGTVDERAATNVEMPPRYEDLASGVDGNANVTSVSADFTSGDRDSLTRVIDNLPAIDSDCNANETETSDVNCNE